MPRPRKLRRINLSLNSYYFKPQGIGLSSLEQVELLEDELEAMRLVDFKGLNMDEAAEKMKISKPTLCRMVNSGRAKTAEALCLGKAIQIFLTNNNMPNFDGTGPEGKGPKTGRGYGKCEGANKPLQQRPLGRGMGRGQGRRLGRGRANN